MYKLIPFQRATQNEKIRYNWGDVAFLIFYSKHLDE